MRKLLITILTILFLPQLVTRANELNAIQPRSIKTVVHEEDIVLPNIFIYTPKTPTGDEVKLNDSDTVKVNDVENPYKTRYDDSSIARYNYSLESDDEVVLSDILNKSINLKGSAEVTTNTDIKLSGQTTYQKSVMPYTYSLEEYHIHPLSSNMVEETGNLKYGTLYDASIDTSQLEYSAGLFTRYDWDKFAISTAYQKNQGTVYGLTTDNFYLTPELKLNNTFSISNVLKADTTRNRRSSELVLNIKPFASQGNDRVNLEFGAGQTYDENNSLYKTQFRFITKIKL